MKNGDEKKIKNILEKYEKAYSYKMSLVGYNGLLISSGFQINYLNEDIVTAEGGVLLDFAKTVIMKIMGEVHIPDNSTIRKFLDVTKLPKRKFLVRDITIDFKLENFITKEMEKFDLIITSLNIENTFLLLILDNNSNRVIKLDLDIMKHEIEEILNNK